MERLVSVAPIVMSVLALAVSITVFCLQRTHDRRVRGYQSEVQFTAWFGDVNRALIDYPELWELYSNDDQPLSKETERRVQGIVYMQCNMFATVCAHYGYGDRRLTGLEREQWDAWRRTMLSLFFESRMTRTVWQSSFARRHYHKRFVEFMDGLLSSAMESRATEGGSATGQA